MTPFRSTRSLYPVIISLLIVSAISSIAGAGELEPLYAAGDSIEYVIHISVDGLRSDAVTTLGPASLPNFYRMRVLGSFTDNGRTDFDFTNTLPNHACQLTGRPVLGPDGHGVSFNEDPGTTLEYVNGEYISGVFDVAHDNGLRTAMYASKPKFDFFDRSWNGDNGAEDLIGEDNGRDKIDVYIKSSYTEVLVDSFIARMSSAPYDYSFVHFVDPDAVGHDFGWESVEYYDVVMKMDTLIGRIYDLIDNDTLFAGKTAMLVTADHGGTGLTHVDPTLPENYTIPFYVTAPGVPAGGDLYSLNPDDRLDPAAGRPDYTATPQPIRNGEVTNLALDLLSLVAIPGSVVNGGQDLDVTLEGGIADLPTIELQSPDGGAVFDAPASVTISATASAAQGMVSKVEFFANYAKIGEDSSSPFSFEWTDVLEGEYVITARAVTNLGAASAASVGISVVSVTPAQIETGLGNILIYPNPIRRSATVRFSLRERGEVEMLIFDALGRRVARVLEGSWGAGSHAAVIDGSSMSPGCYFYHARLGKATRTGKLMVLR
jgi:hypothetical protein